MLGVITLNQSFLLPCISYKVPAILSCTSTKQTKIKNQVTKCTKTGHEARNTNTREVTNPTGFNNFVRENPNSDKFTVKNFHHIELAFNVSVANGAKPSSPPVILGDSEVVLAEVKLYGDVVLRFISYNKNKNVTFLPLFEPVEKTSSFPELDYGIRSLDHAVGNVQKLAPAVEYISRVC
ncbi:4-hydroxyphenylpyruvate dioxygenase [Tanacetum coccineum]